MRGRSLAVPPEEAFAFHVPLSLPFFSDLWTAGRRREVPDMRLGDAQLVDLGDNPVVSLDIPFDSLRFYITQVALDEMANEAGIRRVKGLYAPNFGARDLVMFGWRKRSPARWSTPATAPPCLPTVSRWLFSLTSRALTAASPAEAGSARGGLASWQLRRAREFINANLAGDPSISQVANECGLSSSYFARAFKQATGIPPYRWLTKHARRARQRTVTGPGPQSSLISPSLRLCRPKPLHPRFFQERGLQSGTVAPPPPHLGVQYLGTDGRLCGRRK
jgi:AraC family transcriptional regulator